MDAERTLIILLSIVLIVVLLAVTVLVMQLIKFSRILQGIAGKAGEVADNIVSASHVVKKAAGPLAISGIAGTIIEKFMGKKKSTKKGAK